MQRKRGGLTASDDVHERTPSSVPQARRSE
jgi:hypothetical protein